MAAADNQAETTIRQQAAVGDPELAAAIYDWAGRELYAYLAGLTGSQTAAEELLSDVLVRSGECGPALAAAKNLKAYLYRIAANLAYDRMRRTRKEERARTDYAIIQADESGDPVGPDELAMLRQALADLPPEQRETVVMKIFQNKTFEEIAADRQLPLATVSSRYRYALQKLKISLERNL